MFWQNNIIFVCSFKIYDYIRWHTILETDHVCKNIIFIYENVTVFFLANYPPI